MTIFITVSIVVLAIYIQINKQGKNVYPYTLHTDIICMYVCNELATLYIIRTNFTLVSRMLSELH